MSVSLYKFGQRFGVGKKQTDHFCVLEKGIICGAQKTPEAAWAHQAWLLEKRERFWGPKERPRQAGHLTPGF